MKQQELVMQDLEINVKLKMSEANMIIEALSMRKFAFENLIQNIIEQGNPQLPKANKAGAFAKASAEAGESVVEEEFPIGLSEEVDNAILSIFNDAYFKDQTKFQFDTTRPGHFVVITTVEEAEADKLVKHAEHFVTGLNLDLVINREHKDTTVFVFSWKPGVQAAGSETMRVVKDEAPAATDEAPAATDEAPAATTTTAAPNPQRGTNRTPAKPKRKR